MWFQIELPAPVMLTEIQFTSSTIGGGAARAGLDLSARLSGAGVDRWQRRGARRSPKGRALQARRSITFAPVSAKFVRITQTATVADAPPWSMRLLRSV